MIEVLVDMNVLMEMLDNHETGTLYPKIREGDQVVGVRVRTLDVCFLIDNPKKEAVNANSK